MLKCLRRERGNFVLQLVEHPHKKDYVYLHEFSKSNRYDIYIQWMRFVETKRQYFTNPIFISVLCEKRFTLDCYPAEYHIYDSMSVEIKMKCLLPVAVPIIFTIHFTIFKSILVCYLTLMAFI